MFDTIVRNAVKLGNGAIGHLISYDGAKMELVAQHNVEPQLAPIYSAAFPRPATRASTAQLQPVLQYQSFRPASSGRKQ